MTLLSSSRSVVRPHRSLPLVLSLLAAAGVWLLPAALHAQATKIFVASTGNDANDGSRGAPKRNFQAAHDTVAAGGDLVVLDTAGYGALTINKSLNVVVPPGVNGFITVSGNANGVLITAASTDRITLRGLIIEGGGAAATGRGVRVESAGAVSVEDCTLRAFRTGIYTLLGTEAILTVNHCTMRRCDFGLNVQTTAAVKVAAVVSDCRIEDCGSVGAAAFASSSSTNPVSDGVTLTLADCIITDCGIYGVQATNAGTLVRVDNCRITGNNGGVAATFSSQILSRGNNTLEGNNGFNTFPGTYSAK